MLSLSSLWPQLAAVVRDTILGPRSETDGSRKGRFFAENGMLVHEVEILDATIEDELIAEQMRTVQRESVTPRDRRSASARQASSPQAPGQELELRAHELQAQVREHEAKLRSWASSHTKPGCRSCGIGSDGARTGAVCGRTGIQ